MENEISLTEKRKRKALVVLPLILIPLLTLAFWALGGGKKSDSLAGLQEGLNLQLPEAQLKEEKGRVKMSYYEAAEKDSVKEKERSRIDPLFYDTALQFQHKSTEVSGNYESFDPARETTQLGKDPNEQKVYEKLDLINKQLQASSLQTQYKVPDNPTKQQNASSLPGEDVVRLEQLMQQLSEGKESDPELSQLNGMMDKIIAIQHPEREKANMLEKSARKKQSVFVAKKEPSEDLINLLDTGGQKFGSSKGFYSLQDSHETEVHNAVQAAVHATQTLVDDAVVKLRLLNTIYVDEQAIPAGSFIWGKCTVEGERLQIATTAIRVKSSLLPVNMQVYDLDGLRGINMPGALARDVAKSSADNAVQQLQLAALDPSLKGQAAAAGVDAVKSLLSKKAKLIKVTVKAGYRVLLRNEE